MYELNLQPALDHPGAVIHCSTKDEAKQFMMYMQKYHRGKCTNWFDGETAWSVYEEQTVYYPYFGKPNSLLYGCLDEVGSCHVVEFYELIPVVDLPVGEVERDLSMLFC